MGKEMKKEEGGNGGKFRTKGQNFVWRNKDYRSSKMRNVLSENV